jgi:hypothetical protein
MNAPMQAFRRRISYEKTKLEEMKEKERGQMSQHKNLS